MKEALSLTADRFSDLALSLVEDLALWFEILKLKLLFLIFRAIIKAMCLLDFRKECEGAL